MVSKFAMLLIATLLAAANAANAQQAIKPAERMHVERTIPGLPIHVKAAKPTKNLLAILYSGDGGWQEIDDKVSGYLQKEGIPVVGLDSLNYFWSERTSGETAGDLGRIINDYTRQFNVQHVLLIGYSFGADIMPASYNRLSQEQKTRVRQISLLSLSHTVDYVVSLRGWLGFSTEGKGGNPVNDLKSINPKIVQCIYGKDDDHDNACPSLQHAGIQVIGMPGGHHFDGDYEKLAQNILADIKPRQTR